MIGVASVNHHTTYGWHCAIHVSIEIPESFGKNPFVTLGSLERVASLVVRSANVRLSHNRFATPATVAEAAIQMERMSGDGGMPRIMSGRFA